MNNRQLALEGKLFLSDDELRQLFLNCRKLLIQYNNTNELEIEERSVILKSLLGSAENAYIEPPFRCDYGCNIYLGKNFYANFDCIILDVAEVQIGKNVMLGPRVLILTATHPVDAGVRAELFEYAKSISIGDDVWIGGGAIVNPGVTIGNGTIIGSGSVVTKNIPENVIAAGNPAKIIRKITVDDKQYWENKRNEYFL